MAAALAAVALAPAVAAAQQQYAVDFAWTPSQPTTTDATALRASRTTTDVSWGQVVRFTANGRALVSTKQARGSFRLQRKTRVIALVEQNGRLRDRITVVR